MCKRSRTRHSDPNLRQARSIYCRNDSGVGEAITPPDDYFKEVKKILDKYGILFIADEVQTGVGPNRNNWFGITSYGVVPDMITMAKGLGNGLPIGAMITTPKVADAATKQQINTFGGNPVSSATAIAVLETIEEEKLMHNSKVVGEHLMAGLKDLQKSFPSMIGDVRGKGLMVGMELADENKTPLAAEATRIVEACKDDGVIVGKGGVYGSTIRIKPPMSITKDNVDTMLKSLRKSLETTAKVPVAK